MRVWIVCYNRHWLFGNLSQESLLNDRLTEDQNPSSTSGGLSYWEKLRLSALGRGDFHLCIQTLQFLRPWLPWLRCNGWIVRFPSTRGFYEYSTSLLMSVTAAFSLVPGPGWGSGTTCLVLTLTPRPERLGAQVLSLAAPPGWPCGRSVARGHGFYEYSTSLLMPLRRRLHWSRALGWGAGTTCLVLTLTPRPERLGAQVLGLIWAPCVRY
jgi:hypothetical protein